MFSWKQTITDTEPKSAPLLYLSDWPVDPVDPDTACDEPAAEEEGDEALHRVGGLGVLVRPGLRPPHATQHPDKIFKCRERA